VLEKQFKFPGDDRQDQYDLTLKRDGDWSTSRRRVLIILQTVDGLDLKSKTLASKPALANAIRYARDVARRYKPELPDYAFAVVNWNNSRHLHLHGQARAEADSTFKARILKIIDKLEPTHILFSGDLGVMYPVKNAALKNGWVHEFDGRKVVSTLDFTRLLEKQGLYANLLGFWCRHLANLLLGQLQHSVADIELKPVLVDTIPKFERLLERWDNAKLCGLDTEARSLSVLKNAIYTMQFAFDTSPNTGFVLPIDHPHQDNPFTPSQRAHIKRELARRFARSTGPELITFNGIFDLRLIRTELNLDIIYLPVWEIMAAEHLLDENVSSMASIGIKMGGLAAVFCSYGNDFYVSDDTHFSKAERNTVGNVSPRDPDALKYMAMDAVSILHLRKAEIDKSGYQDINGKSYRPMFVRHMLHQMSDTVHQLSHLKATGSLINKKYLRALCRPDSSLSKAIQDLNEEFKAFPEVQQANRELLAESGFKAGSLFGGGASQWIFSFTKSAHKLKLFIETCGLQAVSQTPTGQDAIDKEFIEHYKDRNFLVAKFGEFQAASKLLSTYVKGWYKQLTQEIDGAIDDHLRADYKFFDVDTGRLASAKPNLQNIPARGKLSKIIKEMFVTRDGHLLIRFDYSAHEVRMWSVIANDPILAEVFKEGQKLRQQWIKTPTDALKTLMKTKGDVHIQNVFRFFGKWVEKSDPLRDAVKAVIFGLIYGKSAATLGNDTKRAELEAIKAKMSEAHKTGAKAELRKLEKTFAALLAEDRSERAQEIIDAVFSGFKRGHQWILRMQRMATEKFYVYSPIGRIRHLYAAMTGDKQIVSRQVRRGMNAPIQGFASEVAVKASRRVHTSYYRNLKQILGLLGLKGKFPIWFNRIVHDALYLTVPFEMVIPLIHILQYEATYGITKAYEDEFGLKFTVEPEIELEIGYKDTESLKWSWALPDLVDIIFASVEGGLKEGFITGERDAILKTIFAPWLNAELRNLLNTQFPLLGVDLDAELVATANMAMSRLKS